MKTYFKQSVVSGTRKRHIEVSNHIEEGIQWDIVRFPVEVVCQFQSHLVAQSSRSSKSKGVVNQLCPVKRGNIRVTGCVQVRGQQLPVGFVVVHSVIT